MKMFFAVLLIGFFIPVCALANRTVMVNDAGEVVSPTNLIEANQIATEQDILNLSNRANQQDAAISNVTVLVGDGVQGVQDQLNTHISTQAVVDAEQDDLIQLALDSATTTFAGPGTTGVVTSTSMDTNRFLRGDGQWRVPDISSVDWQDVDNKPTAFPVAVDATLVGTGETGTPLGVASNIVAGAAAGATAVRPETLAGYVQTNDARYLAALTNAAEFATAAQGATADAALPASWTNTVGVVQLGRDVKSLSATSVGQHGAAFGEDTTAGNYGAAFGEDTTAGNYGAAFGDRTTAGDYGAAFGDQTTAGDYGAAFGLETEAGEYGFAAGVFSESGRYGAAFGLYSTAGEYGFAAGNYAQGGEGSFVFADNEGPPFNRTNYTNSFGVRASGGTYFETPEFKVTGTHTAESYALTGNRLAIPDAVTIPTNSTYTISYTNGAFTTYSFGAGTADLTITLEGPGAGYRSQHEVYWESGYTNRPVTYTNTAGALTWINSEPTTDEAQIMFIWTGTNAAAINTTVTQ